MRNDKKDGADDTYGTEVHTEFLFGNPSERDHFEGCRWMIILKCILENHAWRA